LAGLGLVVLCAAGWKLLVRIFRFRTGDVREIGMVKQFNNGTAFQELVRTENLMEVTMATLNPTETQ